MRLPTLAALGLCLAAAAPAAAQRMRADRDPDGGYPNRGFYGAIGGGAGIALPSNGDNAFAFLGELRLGFSLNRRFQIFLSADSGGSSSVPTVTGGDSFRLTSNFLAALRYFLYTDETIGLYLRGGLGVGLVSGDRIVSSPGANTLGLAEAGGLGVEIRLDKHWSITPEGFYRRTDEGSVWQVTTLGLGILLNYN